MTAFPHSVGAMTLFVEDVSTSKAWYEGVFAAPVAFEDDDGVAFRFDNMIVNLLRRSAAHELVVPASVASPGSGSSFQLTVWVDDLDAVCADLQARGIELLNGPFDRPWGQRTACIGDPDGHVWEFAQTLT